jgi:hypothetical protein
MFRTTSFVFARAPMIRFRYGAQLAVAAAVAAPASEAEAAAVFESPWDLPAHLRPALVSEEEIEFIRLGGAIDAPAKGVKKTGGKK